MRLMHLFENEFNKRLMQNISASFASLQANDVYQVDTDKLLKDLARAGTAISYQDLVAHLENMPQIKDVSTQSIALNNTMPPKFNSEKNNINVANDEEKVEDMAQKYGSKKIKETVDNELEAKMQQLKDQIANSKDFNERKVYKKALEILTHFSPIEHHHGN